MQMQTSTLQREKYKGVQCKVRAGGVFAGSFTPLQFIPMCWYVYHKEVHITVPALQLD